MHIDFTPLIPVINGLIQSLSGIALAATPVVAAYIVIWLRNHGIAANQEAQKIISDRIGATIQNGLRYATTEADDGVKKLNITVDNPQIAAAANYAILQSPELLKKAGIDITTVEGRICATPSSRNAIPRRSCRWKHHHTATKGRPMKRIILALCLATPLGGCTGLRATLADFAISTTVASPTQAKTVEDATRLTSEAERLLDIVVVNGHLSNAVLDELKILVPAVHNALKTVQAANASGDNAATALALSAFNQALNALNAYKTLKGVS